MCTKDSSLADTSVTSTAGAADTSTSPGDISTEHVDVASSEPTNRDPLALDGKQTKKAVQVQDDDPEFDIGGEKIRKSEFERLRKIDKSAKEIERESHKRFMDAAKARKELEAREQRMRSALENGKTNIWGLIEEMGLNPDELAEQRLANSIKRAQMTPEQIEHEKQLSELEELRRFKTESEERGKQEQHTKLVQQQVQDIDAGMHAAFTELKLPASHKNVANVLDTLISFAEAGQPIDVRTAASIVRNDLQTDLRSTLQELVKGNPAAAIELLGPEVVQAISSARVATVQQQPRPQQKQSSPTQPKRDAFPPTIEEVRARLGIRKY